MTETPDPTWQARRGCGCAGGRGGSQLREYRLPPVLHFSVDCRVTLPRGAASAARRPAFWPEIAERAAHTSLRDLADEYGVSHETIRAILKRTVASGPQSPAA